MVKLVYGGTALILTSTYLAYVFHVRDGQFWIAGLGDWHDPYFINALLEFWYHSARALADPSSPTMFFPAAHTLGYSHGLVLYALFYLPLRLFLHPFQAYNVTLWTVLELGVLCLYVFCRRVGLSFVESLVLSAFFVTSRNVMNGTTAVWSQRASVFLIPPIALMVLISVRLPSGYKRVALAALCGLLATLMYVQDFYTAQFAGLFAVWFAAAALVVERSERDGVRGAAGWWATRSRSSQVALAVVVLATAATALIFMYGGGTARVLQLRLAARDWRRPALVAAVAAGVFLWQDSATRLRIGARASAPWTVAFTTGGLAGAAAFLWIYAPAFREHSAFSGAEVWNALAGPDAYLTIRSFILVAVVAAAAWIPRFGVAPRSKRYVLWALAASAFAFAVPLRLGGVSIWTTFVGRLPGFPAIRDPKRISYLYELAVVASMAPILLTASSRAFRAFVTASMVVLMGLTWNAEVFDYERPDAIYDRWVAAPIAIDEGCRSFFMTRASRAYASRSTDMYSLYGVDAMFVSFAHGIPTLNGYSAWAPEGWELWNPEEASYPGRARHWIQSHGLHDVCELDVDARTMSRPRP